jgi:hypothetical protein
MDKVTDILENIKERLSNPLLFSFICSWLVYNWKIPIALFFYDIKQVNAEGCNTLSEYIQDKLDKTTLPFFIPFLYAIFITLLIPIVKSTLKLFNTFISKHTDIADFSISKGGKIEIEKYLKLREEYKIKINDLEKIIESESEYIYEIKDKTIQLKDLRIQFDEFVTRDVKALDFYLNHNKTDLLNGNWKFKSYDIDNGIIDECEFYIENSNVFQYEKNSTHRLLKYKIIFFTFFTDDKTIRFIKEIINQEKDLSEISYKICYLKFNNENLIGSENGFNVEYTKDKDQLPF